MNHASKLITNIEAGNLVSRLKETILERWESQARAEVPAADAQSKRALRDSLPPFIDHLAETLRGPDEKVSDISSAEIAKEHGDDRAEQPGYTLDQVIHEYQILRRVTIQSLRAEAVMSESTSDLINDYIDFGVRKASARYSAIENDREILYKLNQKISAAELIFQRHKFEAIFRDTPAAMALWHGQDLVFELVNPSYQSVFPGRELIGRKLIDACPEFIGQDFPELLRSVMNSGIPFVGTEVMAEIAVTPGGPLEKRYFDFSYIPIPDAEGKPYGVYDHAFEVTDRVRARLQLEESQSALENTVEDLRKEREARERFVEALTHDLRTPLTAAKMAGQLLMRKVPDAKRVNTLSQRIVSNMDRADGMIRDLLDANRLKAGESIPVLFQRCDLIKITEAAVSALQDLHGPHFEIHAKSGIMEGHWDCSLIQRVIENLAGNAVKYGTSGSPVTVTLTHQEERSKISVHNFGNPISESDLSTLFTPYRRLSFAISGGQKGWGVGLTLVQGIVQAHGGSVSVESDAIHGTTFMVDLPSSVTLPHLAPANTAEHE
ncbi:MAG: PAS domain-containing protein [Cryobacterium sp.]|nr:PAS domain-containing protein [Oligoflexia bacterium]